MMIANNLYETTDFMGQLLNLEKAINTKGPFKHYTLNQKKQYILTLARAMEEQLREYITDQKHYVAKEKKELLNAMRTDLLALARIVKEMNQSQREKSERVEKQYLSEIKKKAHEYAAHGVVYLFRHCQKATRTNHEGEKYIGIASHAVKEEAYNVAKRIVKEISISPKKVLILVLHSEEERTRIFGEIVMQVLRSYNALIKNKVQIKYIGYDKRIMFGFWDEEGYREIEPYLTTLRKKFGNEKGTYRAFLAWYHHRGEIVSMKKQPRVDEVKRAVYDFLKKYHNIVNTKGEYYTIVLGFSHSWTIDAYLLEKFKAWYEREEKVIRTASYCKAECGHIGYEGRWKTLAP